MSRVYNVLAEKRGSEEFEKQKAQGGQQHDGQDHDGHDQGHDGAHTNASSYGDVD